MTSRFSVAKALLGGAVVAVLSQGARSDSTCVRQVTPSWCSSDCTTRCAASYGDANGEPGILVPQESYTCQPCMVFDDVTSGPCSAAPPDYIMNCDPGSGVCCFRHKNSDSNPNPYLPCSLVPVGNSFQQCNQPNG